MAKQPIKQQAHSWAVYHLKGTPAQFVGIVDNQPDAESAIKQAIEAFKVPEIQRNRLIAQRRMSGLGPRDIVLWSNIDLSRGG
jgi:hypothetical protein